MPKATIGGKTCFYQDIGKGFPILFGHSYLWSSHMWEPQLKKLSASYRCIAIDLWDHGNSGHLNERTYTVEDIAKDAWGLMQQLGILQFGVVGLSVGGMWAAHMALRHPEAVSGLVLMDTYLGSEPLITKLKYFALLDFIEREQKFSDTLLNQIVPLFFSPATLVKKPHLVENFKAALAHTKKETIPGIVALGRAIFSRKCQLEELRKIHQPSLVVVGKDDIPRPPKEAEEMASYLPNSELHIIEEAGHISNLEQPEVVNDLLLQFFKKISASSFREPAVG